MAFKLSDYDAEVQSAGGAACRGIIPKDPTNRLSESLRVTNPCCIAFSSEDQCSDHKDCNSNVTAVRTSLHEC